MNVLDQEKQRAEVSLDGAKARILSPGPLTVRPTSIAWNSKLPIFASESFLKAVGDGYGWLGGFNDSGTLRCILPYTIVRKLIFRLVRFRVETIAVGEALDPAEEKSFLNGVVEYFRRNGADIIIPATTNTIFQVYPDGADAAPYGSYVVDLAPPEETLWKNVDRITRQNINTASRDGVNIRSGNEYIAACYPVVRDTFARSKLPFMKEDAFRRWATGLGENCRVMIAEYKGVLQSCTLFAFSDYCAYAVYGGNIPNIHQGTMKLLQWEAIRYFKSIGVQRFDFVGARINPEKKSKEEAINLFKKRLGGKLKQGYIWKYPIRTLGSQVYTLAIRRFKGGDIVDRERDKLQSASTPARDT